MLAPNQLLQNRYRIVRQLGHGGMGAVYEAIDERFGEPVALKEIVVQAINQGQKALILMAFEREAKSLAKARHESIPFVRDYFSESDKQFLVMELIEGDDLAELMEKRQKPFPTVETLIWLNQLLDTLDYLHSLNPPIIHRDIKPQNLKINSRQKIKLLDFGVAKNSDTANSVPTHTFIGATLDYSPIEQILRVIDPTFREFILLKHKAETEAVLRQDTDPRCDIYSLGATFYHLLTNSPPADATKRAVEIWSGNADPLVNPIVLNPHIPAYLSDCLLKAMELERDNRFATAKEMQKALRTTKNDRNFSVAADSFKLPQNDIRTVPFNLNSAQNSQVSNPTIVYDSSLERTIPDIYSEKVSTKRFNRLLPLIGLLILAVVGIIGSNLISRSTITEIESPKSAAPIPTPNVSFTATPNVEISEEPDESISTVNVQTAEKKQSVNTNRITKTRNPTEVKPRAENTRNSGSIKKIEKKPAKPAPTFDPNCVFTNSCG